jgi:hypothetical protein
VKQFMDGNIDVPEQNQPQEHFEKAFVSRFIEDLLYGQEG